MSTSIELKASQFKVHSVTVFQADRAEVSRMFDVQLKEGQNEIDISQLPTVLDEDSIRVDGIGEGAIISDVIYHPPAQRQRSSRSSASTGHKKAIMAKYSDTLKSADTTSIQLGEFLDLYSEKQTAINQKISLLQEKIEGKEDEISEQRKIQLIDSEGKKRAVRITILVHAAKDGAAKICLKYLVSRASWAPLYDLRASIGPTKTEISLQYRATVTQRTGEDWGDVELTLSTASPQLASEIPKLTPQWLNPIVNYWAGKGKQLHLDSGRGFAKASPRMAKRRIRSRSSDEEDEEEAEEDIRRPFDIPQALSIEGAISTSFVIDGLSTIPSDTDSTSQAHKVAVAVVDLTAELEWIAVPREQPSAFLQARVKNTSQYMFLPGRANIFLDDNFVAKSEIEHVSPNESFSCSLGVDPQVKMTYHPRTKKTRSQGGLLSSKAITTAYHQKMTIRNTRSTPVKRLLVRDQVPVSGDQQIKVTLLDPSNIEFNGRNTISAATDTTNKRSSMMVGSENRLQVPKEVQIGRGVSVRWKVSDDELMSDAATSVGLDGAREGMIEWVCELGAGQATDLTLSWEVTAPLGMNWGPQ
ncbi:hypothetical protein PIIN_08179 [Serendipita indica DSM 11827]|uniref:Mucoidy inhibitor A n=1 Tax=Serendipita indica (strain DSM 11827) TaxID=1109443 RepID=G4TSD3_SERID|nr:hypothetical protein PIIN_08179 [Serendipita indica DSM 11827]